VFVELAPPAVRGLEENARALGVADKVEVVRGRALDRLARVPAEYDLILADPPYGLGEEDAFLRAAVPRLAPGGLVVLERDIHAAAVETPEGLSHERSARYGTNRLELFARVGSDHHG
jgi:16S rRNA (guanine966-N2)-methyltransferase